MILQIQPIKKPSSSMTSLSASLSSFSGAFNTNTVAANSTDSDNRYLQLSQIDTIQKSFNNSVDEYAQLLKTEAGKSYVSTDVSEQTTKRESAEANKGLSTGEFAINNEAINKSAENTKTEINTKVLTVQQEFIEQQQKAFREELTSLFGDISDGRFDNLITYEKTAQVATDTIKDYLVDVITERVGSDVKDKYTTDGVFDSTTFLEDYNIINASDDGTYSLTDTGYNYVDAYINNIAMADDTGTEFTDLATRMAKKEVGDDVFAELSEDKQKKLTDKYTDFLITNGSMWRYSSLGLYSTDDYGDIIVDEVYETPSIDPINLSTATAVAFQSVDDRPTGPSSTDTGEYVLSYGNEKYNLSRSDAIADSYDSDIILNTYDNLTENSVVYYNNRLYVMHNNNLYALEKISWFRRNSKKYRSYDDLMDKLKEQQSEETYGNI